MAASAVTQSPHTWAWAKRELAALFTAAAATPPSPAPPPQSKRAAKRAARAAGVGGGSVGGNNTPPPPPSGPVTGGSNSEDNKKSWYYVPPELRGKALLAAILATAALISNIRSCTPSGHEEVMETGRSMVELKRLGVRRDEIALEREKLKAGVITPEVQQSPPQRSSLYAGPLGTASDCKPDENHGSAFALNGKCKVEARVVPKAMVYSANGIVVKADGNTIFVHEVPSCNRDDVMIGGEKVRLTDGETRSFEPRDGVHCWLIAPAGKTREEWKSTPSAHALITSRSST